MRPQRSSARQQRVSSPTSPNSLPLPQVQLAQGIKQSLSKMSPRLRQVAEYVLAHYDRASFLSAAQLGHEAGVSEATVVRFAMTLGYPGYARFQDVLQD